MAPMAITDAMFLLGERREHPMHVGGLQIFTLPEGADRSFLVDLYRHAVDVSADQIHPLFQRRAHRPLASLGQWSWTHDDDVDLEYHVRHSALPQPGRVRELLVLASRLHGTLLDRNRPLWEGHLIEGLEGGRFAVYSKFHHALIDGVSALRLLGEALTDDPTATDLPPPWAMPVRNRKQRSVTAVVPSPAGVAEGVLHAVADIAGSARAAARTIQEALRDQTAGLASQAPKTMPNVGITGARRFAAQSWPMERVRTVGKAAGATLNDVVLAMSAGALRRYLIDHDALPDAPLVAMVPVSLRSADTPNASNAGNAVGLLLCDLATDCDDPAERLERIVASTTPLYWNGAQLQGVYPLSIPMDGQALNITVTTYVDHVEFGLTGCRQRVPHLQRLLGQLDDTLEELAKVTAA